MKLKSALKAKGIEIVLFDLDMILSYAASNVPKPFTFPGDACEQIGDLLKNLRTNGIRSHPITRLKDEWDFVTTEPQLDLNLTEQDYDGPNHWTEFVERIFKVEPEIVLAIGDSLVPNLWKAHEAGVRHYVWVDMPVVRNFYVTSDPPPGTVVVKDIDDIIPQLMKVSW